MTRTAISMIPIRRVAFAACALAVVLHPLTLAARETDVTGPAGIRCDILANGLVLVPVTLNRAEGPHLFVLDTGAETTMLSDRLARRLGLVATSRDRMEMPSGSRTVDIGHLSELRLGSERFAGVEVLWTDLQHLRAVDSRIEGVIAQDVLRTRNFFLDYESRRLVFDAADAGRVARGESIPIEWAQNRPMVRTQMHADGDGLVGVERRLVIDRAASHMILFDPGDAPRDAPGDATVRRSLETLRRGATTPMTMTDHGGSAPVMTATVRRLSLASMCLRNVRAALVPVDPRLGRAEDGLLPASFFRAVYFNNRANVVVLMR
jgi:hypothetical protein